MVVVVTVVVVVAAAIVVVVALRERFCCAVAIEKLRPPQRCRPSWSSRQLPRQTCKQNFLCCHKSGFLYLSILDFSTFAKVNLLVLESRMRTFSKIDSCWSWQNLNWKLWAVQTSTIGMFHNFCSWSRHWRVWTQIYTVWCILTSAPSGKDDSQCRWKISLWRKIQKFWIWVWFRWYTLRSWTFRYWKSIQTGAGLVQMVTWKYSMTMARAVRE